jgi:hypothetical protein
MNGDRSATQQLRKSMIVRGLYFSDSVIDLRCVFHIGQMPFVFLCAPPALDHRTLDALASGGQHARQFAADAADAQPLDQASPHAFARSGGKNV